MGKGKKRVIIATAIVVALAAVLLVIVSQTNMLLAGEYYVKINNAHISENDSAGGVINLRSSEPNIYELDAVNEQGDEAKLEFGTSRELREGAYIKVEVQPIRGVVSWSEVSAEELPPNVASALG